jgi:hypothetical protein
VYHIYVLKTGAAEGGGVKDNFPSRGGLRVGMGRRNEIHLKLMPLNSSFNIGPENSSVTSINILGGLNTNL